MGKTAIVAYYEQATGRGFIAWRSQMVRTEQGKSPRLLAAPGDSDEPISLRNIWIKRL